MDYQSNTKNLERLRESLAKNKETHDKNILTINELTKKKENLLKIAEEQYGIQNSDSINLKKIRLQF